VMLHEPRQRRSWLIFDVSQEIPPTNVILPMKVLMRIGLIAASGAVTCPVSWSADAPRGPRIVEVSMPRVKVRPTSLKLLDVAPLDISKLRVEVFLVCGGVFEYEEPSPIGLIELFGSVDSFRIVLSCESVEVVELKPGAHFLASAQEHVDRKVKLPRADAIALRSVLCSDASFDWQSTRQPESRASFRVKFEKDGHVVLGSVSLRSARSTGHRPGRGLLRKF
jgi:hypothetical protein